MENRTQRTLPLPLHVVTLVYTWYIWLRRTFFVSTKAYASMILSGISSIGTLHACLNLLLLYGTRIIKRDKIILSNIRDFRTPCYYETDLFRPQCGIFSLDLIFMDNWSFSNNYLNWIPFFFVYLIFLKVPTNRC